MGAPLGNKNAAKENRDVYKTVSKRATKLGEQAKSDSLKADKSNKEVDHRVAVTSNKVARDAHLVAKSAALKAEKPVETQMHGSQANFHGAKAASHEKAIGQRFLFYR